MIKLETHLHTGGSYCADCDIEYIFSEYKKAGYGALAITNHFSRNYIDDYSDGTDKNYIDRFF